MKAHTSPEPMSVLETRLAHGVHRAATTLLAEAAADPSVPLNALAQLRDFLVANLHHHHETEDHDLWPQIIAAVPAVADSMNELTGEHEQLDGALDRLSAVALDGGTADGAATAGSAAEVRAELEDAAAVVRDIIHSHLSHEEPILLPALREHISPAQWNDFSQKVIATSPTVAGHLMVGFLDQVGTPEEVGLMLSALPAPVQELMPMMRQQAAQDLLVLRGDRA
ncbi:hemerythrin domain-containing protein [Streptacidiphilus sp. ASG 303]|uniref:hemerythrin domain-containing protein n=1 Tax=Streptomycetaceae TaxID=2062 RepID=UPI001E38B2D7|nr:hemerythrin domain-containing protein [Streptacidiphilus sp. ASG 303]MCD0485007.1 hemerythrin domain-containing protein [Streptacidiphilus sp. ASG 303]